MEELEQTSRAIIFDPTKSKKEIITIKRTKYTDIGEYVYYTFPGGHVEKGETFETTVVRELEEELGIKTIIVEEIANIFVKDINRSEKFYECKYVSGEIGTGSGVEFTKPDYKKYGKYEIETIDIRKLNEYNLLPREIIDIIIKKYL